MKYPLYDGINLEVIYNLVEGDIIMRIVINTDESFIKQAENFVDETLDYKSSHPHFTCHGVIDCLGKGEFVKAIDYFMDLF